jgi:Uncharacterized protein conserved in bacteria
MTKRKLFLSTIVVTMFMTTTAQKLIVRADDIGMSHASNIGVIKSYTDGITKSAELMVVTPWLPEAVKMLNEHPGLDVGLHSAFTSEWETMKWRPLTHCPSLTDENGYFFPAVFPNPNYPGKSLMENKDKIKITEFEAEFRAQIELAKKLIPGITHISGHMMWAIVSPEIAASANRIATEYGIINTDSQDEMKKMGVEGFPMAWGVKPEEREAKFIEALGKLEKGKTYLFVEHPAVGGEEMKGIFHIGYENVSEDRQSVLDLFTSDRVKNIIKEKGIELVSYGQLIK